MTVNLPMIGANHSNVNGMKAIAQLQPPLFRRHTARAVRTVWSGYIGRQLNGNRHMKMWGAPSVDWIFGVMYREERLLLATLFPDDVTVRVYDEDTMTWGNYNGLLIHPQLSVTERRQRKWLNVTYSIIDLAAI